MERNGRTARGEPSISNPRLIPPPADRTLPKSPNAGARGSACSVRGCDDEAIISTAATPDSRVCAVEGDTCAVGEGKVVEERDDAWR